MLPTRNNSVRLSRSRALYLVPLVGFALVGSACPFAAYAELSVELEAGVGFTDNINRSPDTLADPAIDDTIFSAGAEIAYENQSARSDVNIRGSLFYLEYQDGPYASETLPALDASAIFRITDQSLSWFVLGNIGQQSVDPFQPITPGNREDISYITTGPSITIPIGSRFRIISDVYYSSVQYEEQPLDNDRSGAQLSLVRQITPNRSFALNIRGERTEFDQESFFPPVERYGAFLRFETEGSRSELALDVGWNVSERAGQEFEEPLVGIEWRRQVSPSVNLTLAGGTRISDAADSFRDQQQGSVDFGGVQDQQSLSTPFRENHADVTVSRSSDRTTIDAGLSWRDEDFEQVDQFDRQMTGFRLNISRQISSAWQVAAFAALDNRDYGTLNREDDDTRLGATLTLSRFRTLQFELRAEHIDRDSSVNTDDYTEYRGYLGIRYTPDLSR